MELGCNENLENVSFSQSTLRHYLLFEQEGTRRRVVRVGSKAVEAIPK